MRTCNDEQHCRQSICISSHQVLSHWRSCNKTPNCSLCSSFRKPVSNAVFEFFEKAEWRDDVVKSYFWLIKLGGLLNSKQPIEIQIERYRQNYFKAHRPSLPKKGKII